MKIRSSKLKTILTQEYFENKTYIPYCAAHLYLIKKQINNIYVLRCEKLV